MDWRLLMTPIFPGRRGEAVARGALLLALFLVLLAECAGCRHPANRSPARRFVRIDALLTLDPAWAQVAALDGAVAEAVRSGRPVGGIRWSGQRMMRPFSPRAEFAWPQITEHTSVVEEYARHYLDDEARILRVRDAERLAREERIQRRRLNLQVAEERARLRESIRLKHLRAADDIAAQIIALGYRQVALNSQVRSYTGQSQLDAHRQWDTVTAEIAGLTRQQAALLRDIGPEVQRALESRRRELEQGLEARLQISVSAARTQAETMDAAIQRRLASALSASGRQSLPLQLAGAAGSAATRYVPMPLSLPMPLNASSSITNAARTVAEASGAEDVAWSAARGRLLDAIRVDTRGAVEQIARARGWVLVHEGTRAASDATADMEAALRSQWRR